jgi:hypothetical protein
MKARVYGESAARIAELWLQHNKQTCSGYAAEQINLQTLLPPTII